ncbi:glycosyltransferase family 9 protein [Turneriella parva]|uniref:Glycosyl transferase family 9 n=1 Tax=Turneriella parva (strain ATCC BAA-1111 / DSM 21527 / NCTC 11395 / H) TaxID=869212 RepID=I4B5X5_TURPD|nr:glycosyltransferase family 9 protein [Turneriella parva]AFM12682.1 glycosyl transferase family 9 [Turneriella parva DSM 21527]
MKEILVMRFSAIGDILLTTPVVAALKKQYPGARITFLVKAQHKAFIAACPQVDRIVEWQKSDSLFEIRKKLADVSRYDLIADLQSNLKSRVLSLLISAHQKRHYKKPYLNRILLVWLKKNRYTEKLRVSDRYFASLEGLVEKPPDLAVSLSRTKLPKPLEKFIAEPATLIAPGARWLTKRWPAEYFASLASKILEKLPTQRIVWLGGPDETEIFQFLKEHPYLKRHAKRMMFLQAELSVTQMAALADGVKVIVANDSGLMHLLSAAKTPLVALFLSTVEEFGFYPLGGSAEVLAARNISCRPCNHKGLAACPKLHFRCGRELTADQVYGAVAAHLVPVTPE